MVNVRSAGPDQLRHDNLTARPALTRPHAGTAVMLDLIDCVMPGRNQRTDFRQRNTLTAADDRRFF